MAVAEKAESREEQRMAALGEANRVRLAASGLRREVREGRVRLSEAVLDPRAASLEIGVLLLEGWQWGAKRVHWVLSSRVFPPVAEHKKVGALTDRQRRVISEAVR